METPLEWYPAGVLERENREFQDLASLCREGYEHPGQKLFLNCRCSLAAIHS